MKKRAPQIDLNPSSADRWTTCTASPKYIFDNWDKVPDQDTTWSQEGTSAHSVAAAMLLDQVPNESNKYNFPVPVTPAMRRHAWNYWEYVSDLPDHTNYSFFVETKFPLWYMPHRNAMVDCAVFNDSGLHIVDYKYGEGVVVSPVNNLQGMIYARCVVTREIGFGGVGEPRPDWPITIHIFQPRTREEETVHKWVTTWGEIKDTTDFIVTDAAENIKRGNPVLLKFAPSTKACQFCPAKGFCTYRPKELTKDLEMLSTIDNSPKPAPNVLTEAQLIAVIKHGAQIKKWIDDASAFALQHMRAGNKLDGLKLVTSRGGNRFWTDPDKVAKYLLQDTILREDEIFTEPKLVSPSAIEALIGKRKFSKRVYGLIGKPPGQPIIVSEDDPRPSALVDGADEFVNLDQQTTNLGDY